MSKQKIKQAYEQLATAYNDLIDHKLHNVYYDCQNTLGLITEVSGKKILDAACGSGKYVEVIGMDISEQWYTLQKNEMEIKELFLYTTWKSLLRC